MLLLVSLMVTVERSSKVTEMSRVAERGILICSCLSAEAALEYACRLFPNQIGMSARGYLHTSSRSSLSGEMNTTICLQVCQTEKQIEVF